MSAHSDAWAAAPPAVQAFYVNFASLNTIFCQHTLGDQSFPYFGYFTTLGWSFLGYRGYDVFQHNFTVQLAISGAVDPAIVVMQLQELWETGHIGPAFSAGGFLDWGEQFRDVPAFAENYPRAKVRPRRSYWTGAPRRRRNL
jgi:hypothetical protein